MQYKHDHLSLLPPTSSSFTLEGLRLPSSKHIFFRAKQREIVDQYSAARVMLDETECSDWQHWFQTSTDAKNDEAFKLIFCSIFYESALFYYNVLVDLSWTLCYISAEFALTQRGERVDFSGMMSIDEAASRLRSAEGNVTSPTAETNPFGYLKKMCPEFGRAIDMIIDFWNHFSSSDIRKKYNYCKHKGKPEYEEISCLLGPRFLGLYMQKKDNIRIELPADTRDVQWKFSLKDSIAELVSFDNDILYPYLSDLILELEKNVNPSPMVF